MPRISLQQLQGVPSILHDVYSYLTGFAHLHGVLHGSGGPYAFIFSLGCSRSHVLLSVYITFHSCLRPAILRVYMRHRLSISPAVHITFVHPICLPNCTALRLRPAPFVRTRLHYSGASVRANKPSGPSPRHNALQTNSRGCDCPCWYAVGGGGGVDSGR